MLAVFLLHVAFGQDPPVLLRDARPVDARGAQPPADLLLKGGRILRIGAGLEAPTDARVIDLDGAYVVPGLIDAHVHISMAPGAAWRDDPPEGVAERRAHHLRALLSWGVTTFADPGIRLEDARQIQALSEHGAAPRPVWIGPILSPPGGYVVDVIPGLPAPASPAEARDFIEAFDDEMGSVGVKLTMEDGFVRPIWPLHSQDVLDEVVKTCAERELDLYVHANEDKMYTRALPLRPRAFVHAPAMKLSREVRQEIAGSGAYVITTLAIGMAALLEGDEAHWTDPRIQQTVPLDELVTARDPKVGRSYRRAVAEISLPKMRLFHGLLANVVGNARMLEKRVTAMAEEIQKLRDAGVSLVMGSDSGNWPALPYLHHGPSSYLEIEGLQERAGLSPLDVLTASTRTPAEMLRIADEVGLIEPGMIADLLVLRSDPLKDIRVLRQPELVIRAGEARTPAQWMQP